LPDLSLKSFSKGNAAICFVNKVSTDIVSSTVCWLFSLYFDSFSLSQEIKKITIQAAVSMYLMFFVVSVEQKYVFLALIYFFGVFPKNANSVLADQIINRQ
jgi:hypothetical protein